MDEQAKLATLRGLVAAIGERSKEMERRGDDPATVRESVKVAADLLCASYGDDALDRASLLEKRQSDPFFARLVRVEIERRRRSA